MYFNSSGFDSCRERDGEDSKKSKCMSILCAFPFRTNKKKINNNNNIIVGKKRQFTQTLQWIAVFSPSNFAIDDLNKHCTKNMKNEPEKSIWFFVENAGKKIITKCEPKT